MSVIEIERITEHPGPGRLGRHREHDARSRAFAVAEPVALPTVPVRWTRRAPIFDQGSIGSCTGNAMVGAVGTDSASRYGNATLAEGDALALYELATRLDNIQGHYEPDDTGSSGLAAAKAAKKLGYITGYKHAFSLAAALHALASGPVIVGMDWLTGCDEPDGSGLVSYAGDVRGGHEIELLAHDPGAKTVTFANSWSASWGRAGYFDLSWSDFDRALRQGGDVTVPTF